MPQYISLADQGFWTPFQMLAEKRARGQARRDALAKEARRQQEADRAFALQEKSANAQLEENDIQRQLLKQSLESGALALGKAKRDDWLKSFDPSAAAGFLSDQEKAGKLWPGGARPAALDLPGELGELVDLKQPQALPAAVRNAVTDFGVSEAAKRGITVSPQELERELQLRQLTPVPDLSKLSPTKATVPGRDGAVVELGRPETGYATPVYLADGRPLRDMFLVDGKPVHIPGTEKPLSAEDLSELQEIRRRAATAKDLVEKRGARLVGPWAGSGVAQKLNHVGAFVSDASKDEYQKRRFLEALTHELALGRTKYMKGPITEREWPILYRVNPILTDTPEYWKQHLQYYVAQLDRQLKAAGLDGLPQALPDEAAPAVTAPSTGSVASPLSVSRDVGAANAVRRKNGSVSSPAGARTVSTRPVSPSVNVAPPAASPRRPASPFDTPVFRSVKEAEAAGLDEGTAIRILDARTGLMRPAVIE